MTGEGRGGGGTAGGLLVLSLLLVLAGCGFHPLYGGAREAPEVEAALAGVKVEAISERIGQLMAIDLRDDFNPTRARVPVLYDLGVTVRTAIGQYAIRQDGTASRELYTATASFNLRELKTGTDVLTGSARTDNSYDIGGDPYASLVARDNAQTRAAGDLAREIRLRVAAFLRTRLAAASSTLPSPAGGGGSSRGPS